jgi:hypothetical protein
MGNNDAPRGVNDSLFRPPRVPSRTLLLYAVGGCLCQGLVIESKGSNLTLSSLSLFLSPFLLNFHSDLFFFLISAFSPFVCLFCFRTIRRFPGTCAVSTEFAGPRRVSSGVPNPPGGFLSRLLLGSAHCDCHPAWTIPLSFLFIFFFSFFFLQGRGLSYVRRAPEKSSRGRVRIQPEPLAQPQAEPVTAS